MNKIIIKSAALSDVDEIVSLINTFSSNGTILNRTGEEIAESIKTFRIAVINDAIVGVVSYYDYGQGLFEIRSLAVYEQYTGKGIGKLLIENIIQRITEMNFTKIFVLTYIPDFFKKFNFTIVSKDTLPEKIWKDCNKCTHKNNCDEIALIKSKTN